MRRSIRRILACCLVLLGLVSRTQAQGLARDDRKQISTLGSESTEGNILPRPPFVDLRAELPSVGLQSMNDCAAWAFGYAALSQLEASTQGWRPIYDGFIFSPTYIYNQVNGGVDQGSNPMEVIKLLKSGAATLLTAPYRPKDHLTQPGALAREEAPVFAIRGAVMLPDGETIRKALAIGRVVVIGIRTNPVFNEGRYPIYTKELHDRGKLTRRPGQPHGYHAMVICGYSEEKQAFLFMNSWGKKWGQDGFVWVSYEVADAFNNQSDITDNLMDFACVLIGQGTPVVLEGKKIRRGDLAEISGMTSGRFHSFDEQERPRYAVEMRLEGPRELRARVQSVTWTSNLDGQTWTESVAESPSAEFTARALTREREADVVAMITLKDGSKREARTKLSLPAVRPRYPELRRIDQYVGRLKGSEPHWYALYYPVLTEQDWRDLKTITWQQGTAQIEATYQHPGGGEPTQARRLFEHHELLAASPRKGAKAVFTFRDGQSREVALPEDPFESPPVDGPVLITRVQPFGREGTHDWHRLEHEVRVPRNFEESVDQVVISTGSAYSPSEYIMHRVSDHGLTRFFFSEFAAEPVQARARVLWKRPNRLPEYSETTESLVTLIPSERGFSISHRDAYVGEKSGAPRWRHRIGLHTLNLAETPAVVTWSVNGGTPTPGEGNPLSSVHEFEAGPEPVAVEATVELRDPAGNNTGTLTLRRTVQASAARNNALGLVAVEQAPGNWRGGRPPESLAEVKLAGSADTIARSRELILSHRDAQGVRSLFRSGDQGSLTPAESQALRVALAPGTNVVEGWIRTNDDGVLALSSPVRPLSPFLPAPLLQVEAEEHYAGQIEGRPTWSVNVSLTGDLNVRKNVLRVDYAARAIDGTRPVLMQGSAPHSASGFTSEPLEISATVHFVPDAAAPPLTLTTKVYTLAPREREELSLALSRLWRAPHHTRPNDTIAAMADPESPRILHLKGPKRLLATVAGVTYRRIPLEGGAAKVMKVTRRERDTLDGFPQRDITPLGRQRYEAEVRLNDGSIVKLAAETDDTGEPVGESLVQGSLTYWGEENGEALFLTRWETTAGPQATQVTYRVKDTVRLLNTEQGMSGARPAFPLLALVSQRTGATLESVEVSSPAFEGTPTSKTLPLIPEPGWTLPLPAIKPTPAIDVGADPQGMPGVYFLRAQIPEREWVRVERVIYEVTQADRTRTLAPFAEGSESGQPFECRVAGPRPERVVATLLDREGSVLRQLEWKP